jgi:DNA repair exonuclease SbcCD ATPase subunit
MQIHNFKGFEKVEIDFTQKNRISRKIFTIFGNQGSGKSTLISAFQWCAYGTNIASTKSKFSRKNIFPSQWTEQEKPISVLVKFRAFGGNENGSEDLHCKRTLQVNQMNDSLEVISGDGMSKQGKEAEELFRQIFGSTPQTGDGVMWVIRQEEMRRMAKTVASPNSENSYYLDFMNLDVPEKGLRDLKEAHEKTISRLMRNDKSLDPGVLDQKRIIHDTKKTAFGRIQKEIETLIEKNNANKLSKEEEEWFDAKKEFDETNDSFLKAETKLNNLKIRKGELPELLNCLLYSKLSKKGVKIEKSFKTSEFDWKDIAEFLESTNWLNRDQLRKIRSLDNFDGYSTISLLKSSEEVPKWRQRIIDLKGAMVEYRELKKSMEILEIRGITKESTSKVSQKKELSENQISNLRALVEKKTGAKTEWDNALEDYTLIQRKLANKSKNQKDYTDKLKRVKILEGVLQSIQSTNEQYLKEMFDRTIERAKYFWKEIDQVGKYEPIIVNEPFRQIALISTSNDSIRYIDIDSNGDASGGESELLLVCTCLAVSEASGAKMPIILDDCFTKVDKNTRKVLVETVAKHFGNLIFVTNDEDKAVLLKASEGRLSLNWLEDQNNITSINTDIHNWWHEWS